MDERMTLKGTPIIAFFVYMNDIERYYIFVTDVTLGYESCCLSRGTYLRKAI